MVISSWIYLNVELVFCTCNREKEDTTDARQGTRSTSTVAAKTKTVAFVIDGADHALKVPAHAEEFVAKVEAFVAGLVQVD